MNRVSKKPKYKQIDCDKKPMLEQSEIWFRYFRDRDNSIITDLFEGQLCSKIECQKCGYKSLSFDNFMDLSISIPSSSSSVEKCLQNFIKAEKMEKCGYKCSNCKAVDKMEKNITIFRFPKILVIHLKRFSRREKISTSISIPQTLNMQPYAPLSGKYII